jgi:hypothetical protein
MHGGRHLTQVTVQSNGNAQSKGKFYIVVCGVKLLTNDLRIFYIFQNNNLNIIDNYFKNLEF